MLPYPVIFKVRVQKYRRFQIPRTIRWMFRLEAGEVFKVDVRLRYKSEEFYAVMTRDGRITIPKLIAEEFKREFGIERMEGQIIEVRLSPVKTGGGS